ncbi:MAG TPA: WXG100 family type VII secretion target [Pseudonocardiaceae bacterium]|jgi:WXG100 family type VII secretion target|nr:WXG100 family type VII secretion target [Pseudonocardiaceae bacterium]
MSAGDTIGVNFGAVSNLASTIDGQVKQIESQLETLRSAIQKLGQEWQGGANEAFTAVQRNWDQSANDLNSVLGRIAVAVHSANESYQNTESRNASSWQ